MEAPLMFERLTRTTARPRLAATGGALIAVLVGAAAMRITIEVAKGKAVADYCAAKPAQRPAAPSQPATFADAAP
ncbi:MAG TPA: hypothetical protein VG496_01550 [Myxococcales bacterium]|nr:hypothetical protein [Myxococcales bacterium]